MKPCSRLTRMFAYLFAGWCLILAQSAHAAEAVHANIALGSVAMDIPAVMVRRLTPVAAYLSVQTGYQVSFRASPNLGSAVEDLGAGNTQMAYLTPVAYLDAHEKYQAMPLVGPLTKGKSTFNLVIVVAKDSPIRSVAELRGRKFAFGDEKALLQPAVVVAAGLKLEDFASYDYLKHYDNIAKAVLNGDFDAGILKDTVAEEFAPKGLRVIHMSPPLAPYLFAVSRDLPPKAVAKLKHAMLALNAGTPETKAILSALDPGYDGFVAAEDKDYNGIRSLVATVSHKK